MYVSRVEVTTEHASRYLQQLCKHWSHKFAVVFDAHSGRVPFNDHTQATFSANASTLAIELTTDEEDGGMRMQMVIADHLKRFAFREELRFFWQPA
ncbi:DUF2218 domain-containing protein [Rhizobiaceae bacterium n13]|uniref:DUF2218 domain-containing protein n=1 Tax=Ferirhizobium litorale TaxID=2927786 RepID=A0AAE3QG50_9HYPH|nr:DUF2218 domain-containing protein [Fererhizobium litorale]MDI7863035.1 DUF2218 domain-containing protein [Fererhizobium litorale]MDI7923288.1 DUF2218 domain-containing protein [Fererhizobium litorale]